MDEALLVTNAPPDVHLVARNPQQMEAARGNLEEWLKRKIEGIDRDIIDFNRSINQARSVNWNYASLERLRNKAVADQEFYAKILLAVEAGYTIVPDFPVDLFAIRVTRNTTRAKQRGSNHSIHHASSMLADETADVQRAGEGRYESPKQTYGGGTYQETDAGGKEIAKHFAFADGFADIVFPVRAARFEVMNATVEAMALKVFDQIGICPPQPQADPLIIGQILSKKRGYTQKRVNFLIAWHLNLNEL